MLLMGMVPELPINGSRYTSSDAESMDERVSSSRIRARRRWVVRTGLLLVGSGVLLAFLVTWQRDTATLALTMRSAERATAALQAHLDATGLLPPDLPTPEHAHYMYASYADRFYAQNTSRPVIIAASAPVGLVLHANGRCVIVYDQGRVRAQWMNSQEFTNAFKAQLHQASLFEQQRSRRLPKLP